MFVQKGYKIQGQANILKKSEPDFIEKELLLKKIAGEKFAIQSIIEITATIIESIIAPSYRFYPETSKIKLRKQFFFYKIWFALFKNVCLSLNFITFLQHIDKTNTNLKYFVSFWRAECFPQRNFSSL